MRKALGRGLDALLPKNHESHDPGPPPPGVQKIPLAAIKPNRLQPRKNFDPERLSELSQSIKEHGLAQPIVVSFDAVSNSYELIAGERRFRAAQLAGLTAIDAVIKTPTSDKQRLALALIENIQRDNLNAIESALAYRRLMSEFNVAQAQLSQVLGKSKSAVSNTLRLLDLPENIQKAVQFEQISEGHARALLMVHDPLERDKLFKLTLEQHLSVRDVENRARELETRPPAPEQKAPPIRKMKSADLKALEQQLEHALGTKVEIAARKDGHTGRLIIHFFSLTDFDNLLKLLKK